MKNVKLCIWIILLVVFQTTVCKYISVNGILPDAVFAFIICMCVLEDEFIYAVAVPVLCGIFTDILIFSHVGVYTIMYSFSAMACYALEKRVFRKSIVFASSMTLVLCFISQLILYIFTFVIFGKAQLGAVVTQLVLPSALYNAIVTLIVYPILKFTVYRRNQRVM